MDRVPMSCSCTSTTYLLTILVEGNPWHDSMTSCDPDLLMPLIYVLRAAVQGAPGGTPRRRGVARVSAPGGQLICGS